MDNNRSCRWFLGSNTARGFQSLYDTLVSPGKGDYLYILKGGPGCGKSTFMRTIGQAAEERGMAVDYYHCAGDPDSLDAVYIPALRRAYMDGTAPHVMEPVIFARQAEYVDLGRFCDTSALREDKTLSALHAAYRSWYAAAYRALAAADALDTRAHPLLADPALTLAAERRARSAAGQDMRHLPGQGSTERRLISAFTARGKVTFAETLDTVCDRVRAIDGACGLGNHYLSVIAREAESRGYRVVLCPDPIRPEEPEAVLLPQLRLGYALTDVLSARAGDSRRVRLDTLLPRRPEVRTALRRQSRLRGEALALAAEALTQAHSLHDELEERYRVHMDFPALSALREAHVAALLDNRAR